MSLTALPLRATVDPNQLVALKQDSRCLVEDSIPIEEDGWSLAWSTMGYSSDHDALVG